MIISNFNCDYCFFRSTSLLDRNDERQRVFLSNTFDLISISTSSTFRFFYFSAINKSILTMNCASFVRAFFFSKFAKLLHHKPFCWISNFRCFSFFCCNFFHFLVIFNLSTRLFSTYCTLFYILFFFVIRINYRKNNFKNLFLRV